MEEVRIRMMSKRELATLYGISSKTLKRWIADHKDCLDEMKRLGYNPLLKKKLPPSLIMVIIKYFGEPCWFLADAE